MGVLGGWSVSYERGTPVGFRDERLGKPLAQFGLIVQCIQDGRLGVQPLSRSELVAPIRRDGFVLAPDLTEL